MYDRAVRYEWSMKNSGFYSNREGFLHTSTRPMPCPHVPRPHVQRPHVHGSTRPMSTCPHVQRPQVHTSTRPHVHTSTTRPHVHTSTPHVHTSTTRAAQAQTGPCLCNAWAVAVVRLGIRQGFAWHSRGQSCYSSDTLSRSKAPQFRDGQGFNCSMKGSASKDDAHSAAIAGLSTEAAHQGHSSAADCL